MTVLTDATVTSPTFRGRRLRRTPALRGLVRETRLHRSMLVAPLFVRPGAGIREEIGSMPGQHRLSVDQLAREAERLLEAGVRSVLLFGLPESKDAEGSGAWIDDGIVQAAIRELRRAAGDELAIIADVCLCEYTSHGHCGVLRGSAVDNDATLPLLARAAVSLAEAGADIVAPSAMMDGQVAAHSLRPRRGRPARDRDPRLRREARLRLLRPVPRGRRLGAGLRRPARLPDGPRQRARGAGRDPRRPRPRAPT